MGKSVNLSDGSHLSYVLSVLFVSVFFFLFSQPNREPLGYHEVIFAKTCETQFKDELVQGMILGLSHS